MMITDSVFEAKILIVDDDIRNAEIFTRLLKGSGFKNVFYLTDSQKVKEFFEEDEPDLLLLDLKMPNCNGFDILEQLQTKIKDDFLPVIILTGQREYGIRLKALKAGAKDFLPKPFDVSEGVTRIRNLLEGKMLHNHIRDQNQTLEEGIQERTRELEDTRMEIVHRLGRAAEYRDNETGMHVIRMGHLCAELAKIIGLDEKDCHLLLNASPMHDVGKIGIPDRILLKPARLDGEEWDIMKTHALIGAQILSGSNSRLMQMAESIALNHHERWDGSGYPYKKKGKDIPLEGRIVALCDVFDALTSERPYKQAWDINDALAEIEKLSWVHFDGDLVQAFKENIDTMVKIIKEFPDSREVHIFTVNPQTLHEN